MKTWKIIDNGKVISKHNTFWLAQEAVTRHFRNRKITNSYAIIPIEFETEEEHRKHIVR